MLGLSARAGDPPQQRRQELLVAGQELAAAMERDRPTHSGPNPASGGVTFLIGGFGGSPFPPGDGPRPRPRATIRDSRPGAATNGARYAISRIGIRNRAATGRTARKNASAHRQAAYDADRPAAEPGELQPARRQQDDQSEDQADGEESGGRQHDPTDGRPPMGRAAQRLIER